MPEPGAEVDAFAQFGCDLCGELLVDMAGPAVVAQLDIDYAVARIVQWSQGQHTRTAGSRFEGLGRLGSGTIPSS